MCRVTDKLGQMPTRSRRCRGRVMLQIATGKLGRRGIVMTPESEDLPVVYSSHVATQDSQVYFLRTRIKTYDRSTPTLPALGSGYASTISI